MTYLELVNGVLRRLRETTVTSVNVNPYSLLIGDFVNDAKKLVEEAWDWSMQRKLISTTLTVNDPDENNDVILVGSGEFPKIESMIVGWENADVSKTGDNFVTYIDQNTMEEYIRMQQPLIGTSVPAGRPMYYSFYGIDSNRDSVIRLYPSPDKTYLLLTNLFTPQTDLSEDLDVLQVPSRPVIYMATALAARERGETGGTSSAELGSMANAFLSDAIARDANNRPEDLIYRAV